MNYTQEEKENVLENVNRAIIIIALFMETTMGYPHEIFFEDINKLNNAEKLGLVLTFWGKNKKWCIKNGISSVHFDDMKIKNFIK